MQFLNPWGFLSFLSIPALIILYILKQQHTEHTVSSTYLWKKTEIFMQASTPWQRLRKNLLFFLQLLLLLILSFTITRPVIKSENVQEEIIVILDSSSSMQANDVSPTRFDYAKTEIEKIVSRLLPGQKISIIEAGDKVSLVIAESQNKQIIKNAVNKMKCGYGKSNMEAAITLADGILKTADSAQLIVYTDKEYEQIKHVKTVNISKSGENIAVNMISSAYINDSYTVMSTVINYGKTKDVTLELYIDGKLSDAKKVKCEKNKPVHTYWQNISLNSGYATVKIAENDILPLDNEGIAVLSKNEKQKILLVSKESYFLEKVLAAVGNFEVLKATFDQAENKKGFDLYIYDGYVPDKFPEDGNVWVINPDKSFMGIKIGSLIKGSKMSVTDTPSGQELSGYFTAGNVSLARFREVISYIDWEVSMKCGELPAILTYTKGNSQRIISILFDFSDSNLPLLKEFPVLIQNMLTYTLTTVIDGDGIYISGDSVEIRPLPYARKISVKGPDNITEIIAPPFPPGMYNVGRPGLYTVIQNIDKPGSEKTNLNGYFTVLIPEEESSMQNEKSSLSTEDGPSVKDMGAFELWPYLIFAATVLAVAEWWVYYRGN